MTTHLTLVVDNSEHPPTSPVEPAPHNVRSLPQTESSHWVHRVWRPQKPARFSAHPSLHVLRSQLRDTRGAVTAEYAIVIIAAVAFAGLLVAIMRSGEIREMLVTLVQNALGSAG